MIYCTCHVFFLLLLVFPKENCAQRTAIITPRGYNASLDPEAKTIFECAVTGADGIQWLVDGLPSTREDVKSRGIGESAVTIVNKTTGSFRASISVERSVANRNTTIICIAKKFLISLTAGPGVDVPSDPVLFQVQGLLGSPPNLMLSEVDEQHVRRLSWDRPFSLDITDEPDIKYYKVCYSLKFINAGKPLSQCTHINQTEFTFLYVGIPLLFTVSALNVVGEGNTSSIPHEITNCSTNRELSITNANQVQTHVSFSLSGHHPVAIFQFLQLQLLEDNGGTTCFPMYMFVSSSLSEPNITNHGIQIPKVVKYTQTNILLSLTVDSDLMVNKQYSTIITGINANGESKYNVSVEFDTYDVQLVNGSAIAGGLELSCTFAEGSQAQSCILAICRMENSMEVSCMNITISREEPQISGRQTNLQPGLYVVREVAEVESDGQVTIHGRRDVLELMITELLPTIISTMAVTTPLTGGVSSYSTPNIGPIIGGGICFIFIVIIIVTVIIVIVIMLVWNKKKREEKNLNLLSISGSESGGGKHTKSDQVTSQERIKISRHHQ